MKRALYFATKLNSRDIQNVIVFGYPPIICSPLLASARKAVFPAPPATGVHRLRKSGRLFEKWFATIKFNSPS